MGEIDDRTATLRWALIAPILESLRVIYMWYHRIIHNWYFY